MDADKSKNFEPAFLDQCATPAYYLNRGASGTVYGPIKWQGSQLAIKQVFFTDGKVTDGIKKRIEEKKDIWTLLEHKNLIRIHLVDLIRLPKLMFIVMDFAGGGSLHKTLRSLESGNKLPIDVVTDWAKQITEGMLYLHEKHIVHRDVKSSNILLMEPFDAGKPRTTLKIADFDEIKEQDQTATMSALVGTCAYMAPEVIRDQLFSKASDVWSFGVVIWEMLSGDIPHKGQDQRTLMSKSINGNLDNLSMEPSFPEDYKRLLKSCWESTHGKRISFHGISIFLHEIDEKRRRLEEIELQKREEAERQKREEEERQKLRGLIATIRTKSAEEREKSITGLTILDNELFVVSDECSEVEVYDSTYLSFSRQWTLKELIWPLNIVSCHRNKCIYISDYKVSGRPMSKEIFRVDRNGKIIKKWSTKMVYGRLSVAYDSNVIMIAFNENKIIEYSSDGQLIREIYQSSEEGFCHPLHALKLTNGHFVVSHGSVKVGHDDDLHRVCIVDADGKLLKSFGGKRGSTIRQTHSPLYLSVDGSGSVMVADCVNSRVLLLDSNLEFKKEILTKEHGLRDPNRILLDESTSRLFVSDSLRNNSRILIFDRLSLLRQMRNVTLNS